jgi:hypothetical protein
MHVPNGTHSCLTMVVPLSRYLGAVQTVHPRDSSLCFYHKCVLSARIVVRVLSTETRFALSPWLTTNSCLSARKHLFTCHLRTRIFPGRCPAALSFITSLLTIYVPWQVSHYLEAVHPGQPGHTGTDSLNKCPDVRVPAGTNL